MWPGMRDLLVALDAATGEVRWRVDFVKQFGSPLPSFGFVCSPLVDGDAIYVQAGSGVVRLNRDTGEISGDRCRTVGECGQCFFLSRVLVELIGTRQLVVQTREKLAGLTPDTGVELWSQEVPAFRGMNILTPTIVGQRVFTSSYGGKSFLYQVEADADA